MKKKAIALLLSFVLAAGSVGSGIPAIAAETTAEEAAPVKEESVQEQIDKAEEAEEVATSETAAEEETSAEEEEPVQEEVADEEQNAGIEEAVIEEAASEVNEEEEPSKDTDDTSSVAAEEIAVIEEEIETAEIKEAGMADDVVDSGTCGENATWTLTGTGDDLTLTISGSGEMDDISKSNIPWASKRSKIKTVIVEEGITSIKGDAFYSLNKLTNVTLPNTLTKVSGFEACSSLTSISIPNSVVDLGTFKGCSSLKSIIIPDGVKYIGEMMFYGCSNLESIAVGSGLETFEFAAFSGCYKIKEIHIKNLDAWLSIYDNDSYLAGDLYLDNKLLTSVVIPEGIKRIRAYAFKGCHSLKSITIPDSVMYIEEEAFSDCGIEEIHINSLEDWLNKDSSFSYISGDLYVNNELLSSIVVPSGVTHIRDYAFSGCKKLTSVTIPDSVTEIGEGAFSSCSSLTSITIPDSVIKIGEKVFSSCSSLTSVTIPDSVTSIADWAFYDCSSLTSITIPDSVTSIGFCSFASCSRLTSVAIPDSVISIDWNAFSSCSSLTSVTIPDSVTYIGDCAFWNCSSLTSITIPDSVRLIGDDAFGDNNTNIIVRFWGTGEQWESATRRGDPNYGYYNRVYYRSIIFNCFSAPAEFKLSGTSFIYDGKEIRPSVTVTCEDKELIEGTDYKLEYKNNDKPGRATVDVVGIGDYRGKDSLYYDILPGATKKVTCTNVASGIKVSWEKVEGATSYYVYRGNWSWPLFKTSALVVTDKDVKYDNGEKFVYKVVATAKGSGDSPKARTATMYRLMPVGITSLTNPSAGKMTVTYDTCYGGSGYVVRYGLKSDMSDAKVITVKGDSTTSRTFSGMKKGKTYYVQVRTYKIDNGVRYYSGYCTTKKITIKK